MQDMIHGRTWERKVRAQYDNRDDGSLHITISMPNDEKVVTFCRVGKTDERNRNRARMLRSVTTARTTLEEVKAGAGNEAGLSEGEEPAGQKTV